MNPRKLYVVHLLMALIPPSRLYAVKRFLLRWAGAVLGENVRIVSTARFHLTGHLEIGQNSYVGDYALIIGGDAEIRIGREVNIGPRCTIVTGSHQLHTEPGIAAGRGYSLPIVIEDGAWLGAASTVLAGVKVGRAAVVAAGAIVTCDVEDSSCFAGVPAKRVKRYPMTP